jgi:hypothetical protein
VSAATYLRAENRKYGRRFTEVPREQWPTSYALMTVPVLRVWRNRSFLVQLFDEGDGRLTINRAELAPNGQGWAEGISWDELMEVKADVGFGDCWAVEVYPPDDQIVNVANMRHLWLLPERPSFSWVASA